MPLAAATRLGPYEIVAPLGAGGMGEVYRARDTRLGREVAIKVLPASLSGNAEVRTRFEREARTVSSLNHPHICTLFDVGRDGDTDYLVMELIEGETLAQRLTRGPLPPAEVLRLGAQIADALDRAHRAGVVHRDLKPGNVMLTKSGAKLMDFGLARATGLAAAPGSGVSIGAGFTQSPTMAQPLTAEGTIIGTFQYMSPEQLEGKEADARSDLWALGCVLYEMATGRRAFEGSSQASLIGAIMHREPAPVSQLAPMTPPALDRLVAACLAKDPADRVQSAHDVKLQLAWMSEGAAPVSGMSAPALPVRAWRPAWIVPALAAVAAAVATALVMILVPRGRATSPAAAMPERYSLGSADLRGQSAPMLSPDLASVVFSALEGRTRQIYRRNLSTLAIEPIAGTDDGHAPFFSPDGAWLGFATADGIKRVPVGGGAAQTIVSEPRVDGADWGTDGIIYFCSRAGGRDGLTALSRVPETGGKVERVATLDTTAREIEGWLPEILPDRKTVLITTYGAIWRIVAVRPDGSRHTVVENAVIGRYVPSGHLLYYDSASQVIMVAPFDAGKARITGAAVPLTEPVDPLYCYDAAGDKVVYVPLPGAGQGGEIVWLDRKGAARPAFDTRSTWTQPRISPDGKRILVRKALTNCELWTYDIERGALARIVQGHDNHNAIWSPDGRRVAYERSELGSEMVVQTVEGGRAVTKIANGAAHGAPRSWSAGGNLLVYTVTARQPHSDIWVAPMDGTSAPAAYLATEFDETEPEISPDGKWIAYVSNETGSVEVFVRPYPDTGSAWQVSVNGGGTPVWSRDGRELFYANGTKMMVVSVETRPAFRAGKPVELFDGGFRTARLREFDVAPDGRFIAVAYAAGPGGGGNELRLLVNWRQEMKRMSGPKR